MSFAHLFVPSTNIYGVSNGHVLRLFLSNFKDDSVPAPETANLYRRERHE